MVTCRPRVVVRVLVGVIYKQLTLFYYHPFRPLKGHPTKGDPSVLPTRLLPDWHTEEGVQNLVTHVNGLLGPHNPHRH